jgi:4-amino-4-deoxy-L-arabinose transferase-like glycosyltransferase
MNDGWRRRPAEVGAYLSVALVLVLFGLPLFQNLGTNDLAEDEPIYAFAVDRMLDRGDWLTPKAIPYDTAAFLEKPPLKFWIVAASMKAGLIPHDQFGQRFWDAAFGAVAFLYVFALGYRIDGILCGLMATLVLFVHDPLILGHGLRSANMEAALFLTYCGGIYHGFAWSRATTRRARWLHPIAVGLYFVLGFMTKDVAAIFLPVVLVVMAAIFAGWRRRAIEDWKAWAVASVLAVVLIAPWFVYESFRFGRDFWGTLIGVHVFERFTSFLDPAHLHPWYFYFTSAYTEVQLSETLILVGAGLLIALYRAIRHRSDATALLLVWLLLPMAAISIGTSKLYHYIFPFLPPLALAAGFVPMALLRLADAHRDRLARWFDRARIPRLPRPARWTLIGLASAAFALAFITPIMGSITLRGGGTTIFRSSTTMRPMLAAAILLVLAGLGKLVPRAIVVIALIAIVPIVPYRNMRVRIGQTHAPMRHLRDCLLRVERRGAPKGVYLYSRDAPEWRYYYYLREPGLSTSDSADRALLSKRLFVPGEQRPVLLTGAEYEAFRTSLVKAGDIGDQVELASTRGLGFRDDVMMLLPGDYDTCAAVFVGTDPR